MTQDNSNSSGGVGWKGVTAISFIVLIGGLILAGWIVTRFDLWPTEQSLPQKTSSKDSGNSPMAAADKDTDAANRQVAQKVEQLEKRLDQIGDGANSAPPQSAAEGPVVAVLRARRLAESGKPLGVVENHLRIYFGGSHPDAVDAIQAYVRAPVSFMDLSKDLVRRGDAMIGRGSDTPLWQQLQREFSGLFKIRKRGEPSLNPTRILQRAQEAIAGGDLGMAIGEIAQLEENDATRQWLLDAGRFMKMKRSLDIVEKAALSALPVQSGQLLPSAISAAPSSPGRGNGTPDAPAWQPLLPPIPALEGGVR